MTKSKKGALDGVAEQLLESLKTKLLATEEQLLNVDFESLLRDAIAEHLAEMVKEISFPEKSISPTAINFTKSTVPGTSIIGGPQRNFSSAGIEDLAKQTQLTIMNNKVVVENEIVSYSANIKKDATIGGKLILTSEDPFDEVTTSKIARSVTEEVADHVKIKFEKQLNDLATSTISGDRIDGGTVSNFSSTGIEDRAKNVQLTILDNATVFENKLVAKELAVKGNTVIDGNLVINGDMPLDNKTKGKIVDETAEIIIKEIGSTLKEELKKEVVLHYKEKGIDAGNLTVNGRKIFETDGSLSPIVRKSKVTEVGILKGLRVQGEAEIMNSVIGHNRIGINTKQPAAALSIWDDEVEILAGKLREHTSFIGSHRRQDVVLTAGGKENIKLQPDGGTVIKFLIANQTLIASAPEAPNFEGEMGDVLFNTKPKLGEPWGWMCLGGARWSEMGILS